MGIPKGTKLTDNPKNITIKIRLDEATARKLETISADTKLSKSEIIRKGIDLQYEQIKK